MRNIKRALIISVSILIVLYAILTLHASLNWQEPPKGLPAWQEWQGEGDTIW